MAEMRESRKTWVKKSVKFVLQKVKRRLTSSQKQKIKNLIPYRLVVLSKKFLTDAESSEVEYVRQLRRKLLNLGFTEKPLKELWELTKSENQDLRRLAARELVLWYANLRTVEGAESCLQAIQVMKFGENDPVRLRQAAIIEAECNKLLGNLKEAQNVIDAALNEEMHADLIFSAANQEPSIEGRLKWINQALQLYNLMPIEMNLTKSDTYYDCIVSNQIEVNNKLKVNKQPKVTVIMPVYNAAKVIRTAIESVIRQTWSNLEIIVVDDSSTDETKKIIQEYMVKDDRIIYVEMEQNGGAYVARNQALKIATGDYVTCNDADDWSHPEKIEKQVTHLMKHPSVIGNTSQQVRATSDLLFYRRGNFNLILANVSSFMFRRKPVMEKVGFLDSVRFAADSEYIRRIKTVFGPNSVVDLETGPLSFQRQSNESLTGNASFGFHGFFMGARKEYFDNQIEFHESTKKLYYEFPQKKRPFPVPCPMLPERNNKSRHFDVIIASDFRMSGGSTFSNVEEIKCQKQFGLKTGLIQISRYDLDPNNKIRPEIRKLIDGDQVQMIVYGEQVTCDVLIVRYPPVLQEWQRYIPEVKAKEVRVIVNQSPMSDYSSNGELRYELETAQQNLEKYFGQKGIWHPIGPQIREALHEFHKEELKFINLSAEDWVNIIDVSEWRRPVRPKNKKINIGRHSRDHSTKWPESKEQLLAIYPESDQYQIHVLGGAESPKKVLGRLPRNWRVSMYDEIHPKDFLAKLDVFVYYTHSKWVESFGRVIIEAMAAGVPVILPYVYKDLFGDAAVYAEINDVREMIDVLMNDDRFYRSQADKARVFIERNFGYEQHIKRLNINRNLFV